MAFEVAYPKTLRLGRPRLVGGGLGGTRGGRRPARSRSTSLCRGGRLRVSHYVKEYEYDAQNDQEWEQNEEPGDTGVPLVTEEVEKIRPDQVHKQMPHGGEKLRRGRREPNGG